MNARDLAASWQLFHQTSGLGAPIANERRYEEALAAVGELMDEVAADATALLLGLWNCWRAHSEIRNPYAVA